MNCRMDIIGRKVWNDNNNAHKTRPASVEIRLLRDGEVFDKRIVKSDGDGKYRFLCLIVWKNSQEKYEYRIDETETPAGYTKTFEGNNVVNTLDQFTITGNKIWKDSNNVQKHRPAQITVNLLQNGEDFDSVDVPTPGDNVNTAEFKFEDLPFADDLGKPYVYTVDEADIEHYTKIIEGFNITNEIKIVPTP